MEKGDENKEVTGKEICLCAPNNWSLQIILMILDLTMIVANVKKNLVR